MVMKIDRVNNTDHQSSTYVSVQEGLVVFNANTFDKPKLFSGANFFMAKDLIVQQLEKELFDSVLGHLYNIQRMEAYPNIRKIQINKGEQKYWIYLGAHNLRTRQFMLTEITIKNNIVNSSMPIKNLLDKLDEEGYDTVVYRENEAVQCKRVNLNGDILLLPISTNYLRGNR
jgi:hypothetical protein